MEMVATRYTTPIACRGGYMQRQKEVLRLSMTHTRPVFAFNALTPAPYKPPRTVENMKIPVLSQKYVISFENFTGTVFVCTIGNLFSAWLVLFTINQKT